MRWWWKALRALALWAALSVLIAFVLFASFGTGYLVKRERAINAVKAKGYVDPIVISTHRAFPGLAGCGKSSSAAFDVLATTSTGSRVYLLVCCKQSVAGCGTNICDVRTP